MIICFELILNLSDSSLFKKLSDFIQLIKGKIIPFVDYLLEK